MGKSLIENEYQGYCNAHQNHYDYLSQSDLYDKLDAVKSSEDYRAYISDKTVLSDVELKAKYPSHIVRQYDALNAFQVLDLDKYKESIEVFEKQINHFGVKGDIYFKPFNILKKIYKDESEDFVNDNLSYKDVNDDPFLHFSIDSPHLLATAIDQTYAWFALLADNMEEGIVIKPRTAFIKGMPPAFKVRNNEYLTMIYGVDFHDHFDHYLAKRNVRLKTECSINDWMLNWQILKVPYKEINKENYLLKNLVFDRIMGEKTESSLDPLL